MMNVLAVVFAAFTFAIADSGVEDPKPNFKLGPGNSDIVGGIVADIKDFPWQVAVLKNGSLWCSGVIIESHAVLTAAHCVAPAEIPKLSMLTVRSGSNFFNLGGRLVGAARLSIHPRYDDCDTCFDYDIAIIHLAQTALATGLSAFPITLWDANANFTAGMIGTVTGWGRTTEGGKDSYQLKRVDLPVYNSTSCRAVYGSVIGPRAICAGFPNGGKDACNGDSGSPFVIQNKLAGTSAFGNGCARPGNPGVYASVPGFRAWIRENAGV